MPNSKYAQDKYPGLKNPEKYIGKKTPIYRSSWEWAMMKFLDENKNVLQWASESIHIPYRNPFTGKNTIYVPDFFVVYADVNGRKHAELVEVKPLAQTGLQENVKASAQTKAAIALNQAKWAAARQWCKANNIAFRIVTEKDIFHQAGKR